MNEWLEFMRNMRPAARWSLGIGLAAVLAVSIGLGWWATRPVYSVLYQDLSDGDAGQIASTLDKWHVPYRYGREGGSIEVPEDQVTGARMRLATEGVPSHGTVGLEIFDNADYGMTEFTQKVNYQRAIQGELERTIMALKEVKFARVHITMKQSSLFMKDEEAPKASVTIAMHEGAKLSAQQVSGIQHLVAAAVEGLDPKGVIVVDDRGDAITEPDGASNTATDMDSRLQEQVKMETALKQKISDLLAASLGLKGASVSVSVALNFDHVKHTEQQVLTGPDGTGYVLHRQETRTDPAGATEPATGPKPAPVRTATSSSVDYENGKSYEEVDYAQGRVQRITVGVIVPSNMPPDQVARLRDVIAAAAGLDASRGDQVQIAAMLPTPVPARAATAPVHVEAQPARIEQGKQVQTDLRSVLPPWARWTLLTLLVGSGLAFTFLSLTRRGSKRLSPQGREAVLVEVRRWLGETGE